MTERSGYHGLGAYRAILLTALALLFGCTSEKESIDDIGSLSSDEIISRVNALSASITTYSAIGSISIETPQMSQSAGFEISIRKPDSVLISVDGPFGITLGKALFTKDVFTAYNALNNTVYEGNPQRGMQSLPFFSGVQPEVIIDAMCGVRRFNNGFISPDSFSIMNNSYHFSFIEPDRQTRIIVDAQSMRITRVKTYQNDSDLLWEEFYTYTDADSVWRPESVRISIPRRSTILEFFFDEISMNPALPVFVLEYPEDADRIMIN